jgi:hypothetical protein
LAKKVITTRVHHLATKLGVNSKDIVTKCVDEGVAGIVNHQSAVSAGLSATIAEWFSDAAEISTSAIETGAKVDVKKARAKAKKTTRKKKPTSQASATDADDVSSVTGAKRKPLRTRLVKMTRSHKLAEKWIRRLKLKWLALV